MSNRCELYSATFIPGSGKSDTERVVGIAEWAHDIPIAAKLLLSGKPRTCRSLIFDDDAEIALVGDYDLGVSNLLKFLDRLKTHLPQVEGLREDAEEFLRSPHNRNKYLVLEASEIFAAVAESMYDANLELLAGIKNLEPQMEAAISEIRQRVWEEANPPGFFARLFGAQAPIHKQDSGDLVDALGLQGWTNSLFYLPKQDQP